MSLVLKGGTVVDPSQQLEDVLDLLIDEGRVVGLGTQPKDESQARVVDVDGCIVAPGFIDMHVHLREPGREDKETIASGARAAAAGGFTSIMCMPNTDPVNDNETVTRYIRERAREAALVNVFPCGAITKGSLGEELAEIGEMVRAGAVAISDDGNPVANNQIMRRALEYSRIFDIPVVDHCEDPELAAGGCMNEGSVSTRLGLPGMSRLAEELDAVRDIILSRTTKGRVHIAHLSTRETLQWVRQAKETGIAVTCEVTPHHFILKDSDIINYDTRFKMNPPLREAADVEAMLQGLTDGTIDCIATDHAPHTALDKETTFEQAANGIIGLESALQLCWEFLVAHGRLPVRRLVELMSCNPSKILRLQRGSLKSGAIADVTVFDPRVEHRIDISSFESKSRNSPFDGWKVRGKVVMTIVGGVPVYSALD